jgi:hypothetical protein
MAGKSRVLVVLLLSVCIWLCLVAAPAQNVSIVNPQATIPKPEALWAVQCGVFSSQESASILVDKIKVLGYAPVWMEEVNGLKKVCVGKCEVYVEALALRESLRDKKFYDAFAVSFPEKAEQLSGYETITPDLPLLLPSASAPKIDYASSVPETMAGLLSLSDTDPNKGSQLAEAGRRLLWRDKATDAAMKCLLAVSREQVAAPIEDLKKARWLAAYAIHYYQNDKTRAYLAFGELLKAHGDDLELRSRAMMERAACLLELSWNQKGSGNEVLRACVKIDACVPAGFRQVHALRLLFEAESLFCAHKQIESVPIFEKVLAQYSDQQRECSVAHLFLTLYYSENNQWSIAKNHLNSVMNMDTSDPQKICKTVMGIPFHKLVGDMSLRYGTKYNDQEMMQKAQAYITAHPAE